MSTEIDSPVMARVRELVEPIVTDLGLDLYDLEQRGGTLRVTLDTPPKSERGVLLDTLSLASRLISKELDQHDPIPSRYTLEVTSPGVERALRRPEHFQREIGAVVAIRLANVARAEPGTSSAELRRVQGEIAAADDATVTVRTADGDQTIRYTDIDRARTVFEWGPAPKPGQPPKSGTARKSGPAPKPKPARRDADEAPPSHKEHTP